MRSARGIGLLLSVALFFSAPLSHSAPTVREASKEMEESVVKMKKIAFQSEDKNAELTEDSTEDESEPTPLSTFGSMLKGLGLTLGVFFVGLGIWKRFSGVEIRKGESLLKVIERTPLTSKTSLAVVEFQGKQVLVSVGSENVQLLKNSGGSPSEGVESYTAAELLACVGEE